MRVAAWAIPCPSSRRRSTGVNGVPIAGADAFRAELRRFRLGDPVVLEIERQGTVQFVAFEME